MDYKDILTKGDISVLDALKLLDKTAEGVLFIVDNDRLVASVSDGDIRRWILKNGKLSDKILQIANYSPHYIKMGGEIDFYAHMRRYHLGALPIVDDEMKIKDIIFLYDEKKRYSGSVDLPVVIMAGGKGTRLYPYTKILPKPLIPIGDIPISEHIVNSFRANGCRDFYFIVNYKKNMIKSYFSEIEHDYNIEFIEENIPLGTGGGVSLLDGKIDEPFILTNCDSIIQESFYEIYKLHKEQQNVITMICSLRNYEVPYGVVEIGENGSIKSMKEKPSMSYFTNTGTYIVEPEVINMICPETFIGFPDVIEDVKSKGGRVGVFPINENAWLDMGQFDTMENMKVQMNIIE